MDKKQILETINKVKESSKKRNFVQSYDLIINLKSLDLKKPDNHVDFFLSLPHGVGKKVKVCALVGLELKDEATKHCDKVILANDFPQYANDKKLIKKLAEEYDYFIAQANIMAKVATTFGKVLGVRQKMPNPKAGCIVPPKASLKPLVEKLQNLIRISAKKNLIIHLKVGSEKMDNDQVVENIHLIYTSLINHLPNEKNNLKNIFLKLTMTKSFELGK
tara:strand:- start:4249 stop:4905 length:657 start_codon:yes stop_codon:yes gene_type:complete